MKIGVQISDPNTASRSFDAMIRALQDERRFRADMKVSLLPVRDSARAKCRRKSGKTADDIDLRDAPSAAGTVVMALAAKKRAHVLSFLELWGVGKKKRKYPCLRPALDADNGGWIRRLSDLVHARREAAANA